MSPYYAAAMPLPLARCFAERVCCYAPRGYAARYRFFVAATPFTMAAAYTLRYERVDATPLIARCASAR